mmetsp:Transcript_9062/g.11563  ORF Transcript_9062/g.11563 Transcript_9062/m.11563 type:complete len:134 (-) Transcript_9062:1094-1495(-)
MLSSKQVRRTATTINDRLNHKTSGFRLLLFDSPTISISLLPAVSTTTRLAASRKKYNGDDDDYDYDYSSDTSVWQRGHLFMRLSQGLMHPSWNRCRVSQGRIVSRSPGSKSMMQTAHCDTLRPASSSSPPAEF